MLRAVEAAAASLRVAVRSAPCRDNAEIEATTAALAREERGGLLVLAENFTAAHRDTIISFAAQYRLPAIYPSRTYAAAGGLMSYGPDPDDLFRRAASYVDRILRGAKPADLPVQLPTKFALVINLKTAKALGITVPLVMQMTADEVIE
jgi:putative tryptophan/tyrosine transport system substrate-binding protein